MRPVASTLRLSDEKEHALQQLAETLRLAGRAAPGELAEPALPAADHSALVADSMRRQLSRYADLMTRLSDA